MTHALSQKSLDKLVGVHPDLVKVFTEAITDSPLDFSITEGVRSAERQKMLFDSGKSKTMKSRHLTGHAVDFCVIIDGAASWDMAHYKIVTAHLKETASRLGQNIECGSDWLSFPDGPHVQLPWKEYP